MRTYVYCSVCGFESRVNMTKPDIAKKAVVFKRCLACKRTTSHHHAEQKGKVDGSLPHNGEFNPYKPSPAIPIMLKRLKCDICNKFVKATNKLGDGRFYCPDCGRNLGIRI